MLINSCLHTCTFISSYFLSLSHYHLHVGKEALTKTAVEAIDCSFYEGPTGALVLLPQVSFTCRLLFLVQLPYPTFICVEYRWMDISKSMAAAWASTTSCCCKECRDRIVHAEEWTHFKERAHSNHNFTKLCHIYISLQHSVIIYIRADSNTIRILSGASSNSAHQYVTCRDFPVPSLDKIRCRRSWVMHHIPGQQLAHVFNHKYVIASSVGVM